MSAPEEPIVPLEPVGLPEGAGRWADAGRSVDLLGAALVVAAAALPVGQLLQAWAAGRNVDFGANALIGDILRSWVGSIGIGPSVLLLAALLVVGLTAARPLRQTSRRTLLGVTLIGLIVAVALCFGAVDVLFSSAATRSAFATGEGTPVRTRIAVALGMVASASVAGVSAWVAFMTLEQDRVARAAAGAPAASPWSSDDPASDPDA